MNLRATQLYTGLPTPGTWTTLFTVSAGHRIILKSMQLDNQGGSAALVEAAVHSGYTAFSRTLDVHGSAGGSYEWRPWIVLNAGDMLFVLVQASRSVSVQVSGSEHYI